MQINRNNAPWMAGGALLGAAAVLAIVCATTGHSWQLITSTTVTGMAGVGVLVWKTYPIVKKLLESEKNEPQELNVSVRKQLPDYFKSPFVKVD